MIALLANAVTEISMFVATSCSFIIMKICKTELTEYNAIEYILIGVIQITLVYLFFKIKRFKKVWIMLQQ